MDFGMERLHKAGIDVTVWEEDRNLTPEELVAHCQKVDGLLNVGMNQLNRELMAACPNLKVISLHSVGYDHVDLEAAKELGIKVGNTPGVLTNATADTAFLLIQSVARNAFYLNHQILEDNWKASQEIENFGIELRGKTLGIFGLGSIGFALAKRCKAVFDMEIIYHNRGNNEEAEKLLGARRVELEELLAESDVISIHANLTTENTGIFNDEVFQQMKQSAIFINTARGGFHNELDLILALQKKHIWGAGLDVTNPEPMHADNPLLTMPHVCVLPHIGSATLETRTAMLDLAIDNLIAGLNGKPLKTELI
ncbi:Glyoxylate reductase [Fluviicola taffensis DSM 16823]|uniref:Glyoxylate/hydroxypyruvate reductase B n=2 Tax=Fluviicola TaxID=332102 RepID=F2IEM4_FLUTR|nr:Glyoxylate reductase [Fluviicola taffensis DSM 16823]